MLSLEEWRVFCNVDFNRGNDKSFDGKGPSAWPMAGLQVPDLLVTRCEWSLFAAVAGS